MDVHINHVCLGVSRFVDLLYRNSYFFPTDMKLSLLKPLCHKRIIVSSNRAVARIRPLKRLQVLQKQGLLIVYNLARDHPSAQLSRAADIPTVFKTCNLRLVLRYQYEIKKNISMLADLAELA